MLDGVSYTLKIGVEDSQTTYEWSYLPDDWEDLGKLASMLAELNMNL